MSSPSLPYPAPEPMSPEVAASIRLPWTSLLSREELVTHVSRYPGLAWHIPGTSHYIVAGPWRNRPDILEVFETRGERHRLALWTAVLSLPSSPYGAVLVDATEYRVAGRFYEQVGVGLLEEVLVLRSSTLPGPTVDLTLEMAPMRSRGVRDLMEVDRQAFPWFWRNSREEFEEYLDTPGVSLWVALEDGEAVGYVGITELGGWGHIDRLAVRPERQGRGYGTQLLSWGMRQLYGAGARYVQLSTQESNDRSQGLYRRFGFRQTRGAYKLYGAYIGDAVKDADGTSV